MDRAPSTYRSGVALVNAILRERYGRDQIVLTRSPAGYYYFRGAHPQAMTLDSIMWYKIDTKDAGDIVQDVARQLA